jgi:hypothetical protein
LTKEAHEFKIKCNLFYKYFKASNCLNVTFKDTLGCRQLASYDISDEYEPKTHKTGVAEVDSNFHCKTYTLLSEYLSRNGKFDVYFRIQRLGAEDDKVVAWLLQVGPSLEEYSDWGAYWVLTQAVIAGARFLTLKRLIS